MLEHHALALIPACHLTSGSGLMWCYFNLANTGETIKDETGVDVADREEAYTLALSAIAEMVQDGEAQAADWRGWRLVAVDGSGVLLFTISLGSVLT